MTAAAAWDEVGDRVLRRRHAQLDLNVGLVLGDEHVLVVDSRAHDGQADELLAAVRLVTSRPVTVLVNTHHHWDHTFGNARFVDAEVVGHRRCRDQLLEHGATMRDRVAASDWMDAEDRRRLAEVEIRPPERLVDDVLDLELGGRTVRVQHLGRGHTDNDVVVLVDDVLFAGDLVEEGAPPQFGDAHPTEWVATLDRVAALAAGTVVPGHGDVVDRAFVEQQRDDIARALSGEPVFPDDVLAVLRSRT